MQRKDRIAAVILTKDEELHIGRCIRFLLPFCSEIWVIDSFSTDHTEEIAKGLGAQFVQHPFENQAQQFNWGIDHLDIRADWIWRVDADEVVSAELGQKVCEAVATCPDDVNGIYVNKAIVFQGRKLKHGGWYPAPQIKIIRKGYGRSENKVMDEHLIITSGRTICVDGDQTDENLHDLTWWTEKHNRYATREAENMLRMRYGLDEDGNGVQPKLFGNDAERKRWLKLRYARMPLYVRPFLYFFVRYILKLGFLDGKRGFTWYVLQGFWYRFLVDAKVYEIKKNFGFDNEEIRNFLRNKSITKVKRGGVKWHLNTCGHAAQRILFDVRKEVRRAA